MRAAQGYVMTLFRGLILLGISYVILSPVLGIISNSVKSIRDVYNPLVYMIPEHFTADNLISAYNTMNYGRTAVTTLVFTLGITVIQVLITSLVGYGFARFRFPGRNLLFAIVIITIVVPVQTYMTPMYIQFRYFNMFGMEFNLLNKFTPVILLTTFGMGVRSGLYIYIFRQFFRGLPKEIEEAALIDGAGQIRTYLAVMMPNAVSSIITVAMFSFVWQYNDTYYASLLMSSLDLLSVKLTTLGYMFSVKESIRDPNHIRLVVNAGIVLAIMPILAVYLVMQRYFMEGIERSGIVG